MKYYRQIVDNQIISISINGGGEEITETEYNKIMEIIQSRPSAEGKGYRLKTDLTWEEYVLPPDPEPSDEDELTDAEALNILLGGGTA